MFLSRSSPLYLASTVILGFFALSISWLQAQAPTGTVTSSVTNILPVGNDLEMTVDVVSPGPTQLRWLRDGKVVSGATASTLTIPAISLAQAGSYRLEARNASGTWKSPVIRVGVYEHEALTLTHRKDRPLILEAKVAGPMSVIWYWFPYTGGVRESSTLPVPALPNGTHTFMAQAFMNEPPASAEVALHEIEVKGYPLPPYAPENAVLKVGEPYGPANVVNHDFPPTEDVRFMAKGLPPGIIMAPDGNLSGTPTRSGYYTATLYTTDGIGRSRDVTMGFNVESSTLDRARRYSGILNLGRDVPGASDTVVTVQVSPTGAYSAQARGRFSVRRWTGKFERAIIGGQEIIRDEHSLPATANDQSVELVLTINPGYSLGIRVQGALPTPSLIADYRPIFEAKNDIQGPHTLWMTAPDILGFGIGTATVTPAFMVNMVGTLPDGTGVTASGPLDIHFQAALLLQSPDKRDSAIINHQIYPFDQSVSNGEWIKTEAPKSRVYPEGFNKSLQVVMQRYFKPASGKFIAPVIAETEGICDLRIAAPARQTGQQTQYLDRTFFRLNRLHQAKFDAGTPYDLNLDIYARTGFFTGSFLLPAQGKVQLPPQRVYFKGMLNWLGQGYGQFTVEGIGQDPQTGSDVPRYFTGGIETLAAQR